MTTQMSHEISGSDTEDVMSPLEIPEGMIESLHELFSQMFTKNSLEMDDYLKSKVSASGAVPIDVVSQAPKVLDICSNPEIIKKALFECRSVYIAEDGVRSFVKPEQNTLILRDIPSSTSPEEIAGIFSNAPDCPLAELVKPDMNDTWFVSFASEGDARAALLAIRNAKFLDKPVRARLKTESLNKSFYSGNAYGFAGQVGMPNFNFSSPSGSPQIPGMQAMFFPSAYPLPGPPSNYPIPPMVAMPPMMGYPMMMPRPMQWATGAMQYQQQPFANNGMQGRQGRGGVQRQHRNGRGTPNGRGGFTQGENPQGGRSQYGQNQYPRGYNQGNQYRQGAGGVYRGQGERRYPGYDEMNVMLPDGFKSGDDVDGGEPVHFVNDDNIINDDHDGDKPDMDINGEKGDYNQGDSDYVGFLNDSKGMKNRKNRKNEDGTLIADSRKKDDMDGDIDGDKNSKNRNNRTVGAKKGDNRKGDKVGRRDVRPAADFNFESDFPTLGNNSPGNDGNYAAPLSAATGSKVFMSGYAAVAAAAGKSPTTVPTGLVSSSSGEKSKDGKSKDSTSAKVVTKSDKASSISSPAEKVGLVTSSSSSGTSLGGADAPQSEVPITFGAFDAPINSNTISADSYNSDLKSQHNRNNNAQTSSQQQLQQQPDDSKGDTKTEGVWGSKRSFVEVVRTAK